MTTPVSSHRESLPAKARRLLDEGRVESVGVAAVFDVAGDHGTYRVVVADGYTACPCPAQREACSHVLAAQAFLDELGDERAAAHVLRSAA